MPPAPDVRARLLDQLIEQGLIRATNHHELGCILYLWQQEHYGQADRPGADRDAIAQALGIRPKSVYRIVDTLRGLGLIRPGDPAERPIRYSLNLTWRARGSQEPAP